MYKYIQDIYIIYIDTPVLYGYIYILIYIYDYICIYIYYIQTVCR